VVSCVVLGRSRYRSAARWPAAGLEAVRPRNCRTSSRAPQSSSARSSFSASHRATVSASVIHLVPASRAETVGRDQPIRSAKSSRRRREPCASRAHVGGYQDVDLLGAHGQNLACSEPCRHSAKTDLSEHLLSRNSRVRPPAATDEAWPDGWTLRPAFPRAVQHRCPGLTADGTSMSRPRAIAAPFRGIPCVAHSGYCAPHSARYSGAASAKRR
jgi:hypothetical protein